MCLSPLDVSASGNSARFLFLERVTFLTSMNDWYFLLETRKSNLVLAPNFVSGLISILLLNPLIKLF